MLFLPHGRLQSHRESPGGRGSRWSPLPQQTPGHRSDSGQWHARIPPRSHPLPPLRCRPQKSMDMRRFGSGHGRAVGRACSFHRVGAPKSDRLPLSTQHGGQHVDRRSFAVSARDSCQPKLARRMLVEPGRDLRQNSTGLGYSQAGKAGGSEKECDGISGIKTAWAPLAAVSAT